MATEREIWLEAGKRNILPSGEQEKYDELVSRGLIDNASQAEPTPGPVKQLVGGDLAQSASKNIAQPANEALLSQALLPSDMINAGLDASRGEPGKGVPGLFTGLSALDPVRWMASKIDYRLPTDDARQAVADTGMTAQPGQEATGILPSASRIFAGGVTPYGLASSYGRQAAGTVAKGIQGEIKAGTPRQVGPFNIPGTGGAARPARNPVLPNREMPTAGVASQIARDTYTNPGRSLRMDAFASFLAGAGGEVAARFGEENRLAGEVIGGFMSPVPWLLRTGTDKPAKQLFRSVFAGNEEAKMDRAAQAMQRLVKDPVDVANRIDPNNPLPPALQTGDEDLVSVANYFNGLDRRAGKAYQEKVDAAIDNIVAKARGMFENGQLPQARIQEYVDRMTVAAEAKLKRAAENFAAATERLGPDADLNQISRVAREELESAERYARRLESEVWKAVDQNLVVNNNYANLREFVETERANASQIDGVFDESLIPPNVRALLRGSETPSGAIVGPDGKPLTPKGTEPYLAKDGQTVRSDLGDRAASARNAGERGKLHWYNGMRDAILRDLETVEGLGIKEAIAYSRGVNEKFKQGVAGRILSTNRWGATTADEETLYKVLNGQATPTQMRQFLEASPESRPDLEQYLKTNYAQTAVADGQFNQKAHDRFMANYRGSGVFDEFPNLQQELNQIRGLAVRENQAGRKLQIVADGYSGKNKSNLVALYLDESPDAAMNAVLSAKNPVREARRLVARMNGDEAALEGLKQNFVEALYQNSLKTVDGEGVLNGKLFRNLIRNNGEAARALGFTREEISRLKTTADSLARAQTQSSGKFSAEGVQGPGMVMDFFTSLLGAKLGQQAAMGGMGSSIKMAAEGSKLMKATLGKFTKKTAMRLIIDAQTDPVLYRALLTRNTAPPAQIERATNVIEAWLAGAGLQEFERQRQDGREEITLDGF